MPGEQVTGTGPHSLDAVAGKHVGNVGLTPRNPPAGVPEITGGVTTLYVTVTLCGIAALPHTSDTFHVRVTDQLQPPVLTALPVVPIIKTVTFP